MASIISFCYWNHIVTAYSVERYLYWIFSWLILSFYSKDVCNERLFNKVKAVDKKYLYVYSDYDCVDRRGAQIDKLSRSYDYERILLWTSSYHMWEDHKIVGVGLANWKDAYQQKYILPEAKEPDLTMPHNVFMIFLSQTGIIGTLGYLIFVIGTMVFLIKR